VLAGSGQQYLGYLPDGMRQLRRVGNRHFRRLQDPPIQEFPLSVMPAVMNQITWRNGVAYGEAKDSDMTYLLAGPGRVLAVRLTYAYELPPDGSAILRISWKQGSVNEFSDTERNVVVDIKPPAKGRPPERTQTIWINDTIDTMRLQPDNKPYVFHQSKMVLLVPPGEAAPPEPEPKS
jgi:hypothetical protein